MNVQDRYSKGIKLNKEGKYEQALREFNKIIEVEPRNADAYSDRGVSKFHLKDLKGALDDMNLAVNLEPENPYRYASRAYIRERNGDIEGAITDYRKSIELDPENAISHNNLGLLEERLGYLEIARNRFKKADELAEIQLPLQVDNTNHETDVVIESLLRELNIPLQQETVQQVTLFQLIKGVFTSRKMRRDYFNFLKAGFRKLFGFSSR